MYQYSFAGTLIFEYLEYYEYMHFLILKFIFNSFYIKLGSDSYIFLFFKSHILTNLLGSIPDSEYKYVFFVFCF